MIEFYVEIRWVHVAAVLFSGALFALRGVMVLAGHRVLALSAPLRYLSYTVDTILLTAALMLMTMMQQYPFVHGWLTIKVVLLVVYIVLGSLALKRASGPRYRLVAYLSALGVYLFIIGVARAHHPLGWLQN